MSRPPWIKPASISFKQPKTYEETKRYNNHKWRTQSGKFFRGKPCEIPGCLRLAECTDHIIRVEEGGSMYDRRNWQAICHHHHNKKRAAESRGKAEDSIETPHGRIPTRRAHLPPDIAGQSHLISNQ